MDEIVLPAHVGLLQDVAPDLRYLRFQIVRIVPRALRLLEALPVALQLRVVRFAVVSERNAIDPEEAIRYRPRRRELPHELAQRVLLLPFAHAERYELTRSVL